MDLLTMVKAATVRRMFRRVRGKVAIPDVHVDSAFDSPFAELDKLYKRVPALRTDVTPEQLVFARYVTDVTLRTSATIRRAAVVEWFKLGTEGTSTRASRRSAMIDWLDAEVQFQRRAASARREGAECAHANRLARAADELRRGIASDQRDRSYVETAGRVVGAWLTDSWSTPWGSAGSTSAAVVAAMGDRALFLSNPTAHMPVVLPPDAWGARFDPDMNDDQRNAQLLSTIATATCATVHMLQHDLRVTGVDGHLVNLATKAAVSTYLVPPVAVFTLPGFVDAAIGYPLYRNVTKSAIQPSAWTTDANDDVTMAPVRSVAQELFTSRIQLLLGHLSDTALRDRCARLEGADAENALWRYIGHSLDAPLIATSDLLHGGGGGRGGDDTAGYMAMRAAAPHAALSGERPKWELELDRVFTTVVSGKLSSGWLSTPEGLTRAAKLRTLQFIETVSRVRELRSALFGRAFIPVFGVVDAGKSTLMQALHLETDGGLDRSAFASGFTHTRYPAAVDVSARVDDERVGDKDWFVVVDWPGFGDESNMYHGAALSVLPMCAGAVLVFPYDQIANGSESPGAVLAIVRQMAAVPMGPVRLLVLINKVDEAFDTAVANERVQLLAAAQRETARVPTFHLDDEFLGGAGDGCSHGDDRQMRETAEHNAGVAVLAALRQSVRSLLIAAGADSFDATHESCVRVVPAVTKVRDENERKKLHQVRAALRRAAGYPTEVNPKTGMVIGSQGPEHDAISRVAQGKSDDGSFCVNALSGEHLSYVYSPSNVMHYMRSAHDLEMGTDHHTRRRSRARQLRSADLGGEGAASGGGAASSTRDHGSAASAASADSAGVAAGAATTGATGTGACSHGGAGESKGGDT